MESGEQYEYGAWLYVPEQDMWCQVNEEYYKEDDELSEKEANQLGYFKKEK